jgi:hypothetical protein
MWDDVPNARCWTPQQIAVSTYMFSGKYYEMSLY